MRKSITRFAAAFAVLAGTSCDGPGNTGKSAPDPALVRAVPWLSGVLPAIENGEAVIPPTAVYPPIASGRPDPGSQRTNCTGVTGYEFSRAWLDTFETVMPADPNETGVAGGWSSYDDLTKHSFHTPGDATWYPGLMGTIYSAWGLPAEKIAGPSCNGEPNNWVLHFRGGLFRKWGGGISHAFIDPVGRYRATPSDACLPEVDLCPPPLAPGAVTDSAGLPVKAASGEDYKQSHDFFDVSGYEGVAFWARRGPEGFHKALVILTDKFTSSRLARENQQYCRRVRECHTACLSGAPCSPDNPSSPTPVYRCFDPSAGPLPAIAIESLLELMYPRCGQSACTSPTTYLDPDFDSKTCRPYSFPAADEHGEFCWNENDPLPPPQPRRTMSRRLANQRGAHARLEILCASVLGLRAGRIWETSALHGFEIPRHDRLRGPDGLG